MADDWQTVPNKPARQTGRGRGRGRGRDNQFRSRSRNTAQADGNWRSSNQPSRSRSRAPAPAPAPNSDQFKLQTSNMFELHVGRSSRARKNEALRDFFEANDESDGEETFDAIDDNDLDVSDYESEDDSNEATEFPPVPVSVECTFCADRVRFESAAELSKHLRTDHQLVFKNLGHMVLFLQRYIDAWARELETVDVAEVAVKDADGSVYHIDASVCDRDREIRESVQKEELEEVLRLQSEERRGVAQEPRKCLFCKLVCADRADLFRHGYREHSFNIGLPDNLVRVNEFLALLTARLNAQQCVYCEKTFTSAAVLRKHMRKKKHFKISSHNRLYDRFYVVNYLEPGKSWEAIETENAQSDGSEHKDEWSDWSDRAELPARSLLDAHVTASADECWAYMRREYGFDIHELRTAYELDFYKTVVLINSMRRATRAHTCFACAQKFDDDEQLTVHFKQNKAHLVPPPVDAPMWSDKSGLRPVLENDPLLMAFDDDDAADDEDTSQKRLEESKRVLREKLDRLSLESTGKA
ncbi:hypothetical protein IWW56_000926 [Coemansia sp. RSA 2131]|nr:hypothetical protein IWW56_000926 [Coemansia sp. RSA 2131]